MSRRERREKEEREEKRLKEKEKEEKKRNKRENKKAKKKGKKKPNIFLRIIKGILKTLLVILLIIIILMGILIGWLGFTTNWDFSKMVRKGAKQAALLVTGQTQEDIDKLDPIYCLVMGVSIDIDAKLTDTIILCAYYPKTQQASMLSIPRDTFVGNSQYSAGGGDKINALYSYGGPEKTVSAVEKLTGLDIPNYLVIDTQSLIKVVDKIGGVYFDVPIDMDYDDSAQNLHIHLSKGYQLIDGKKAEQLLRFRKNNNGSSYPYEYGDNDIGRMKTQRAFITETIKQTIKFKNVTKIKELVNIAYENVETNANIDEVMKYVPAAIDFEVSAIKSNTLPGIPQYLGPQKLSFFVSNKTETKKIIDEMFTFNKNLSKEDIPIDPSNLKVSVLNGCGNEEATQKAIDKLEDAGYTVENSGITSINKTTKVINRSEKSEEIVSKIIDTIGAGGILVGKDYTTSDFTVIVGQDYA